MTEDQTTGDARQLRKIHRAINTIGRIDPKSAQKRLSKAQGLLYGVQENWSDQNVAAAASIIRSVGVALMKEAASLNKLPGTASGR